MPFFQRFALSWNRHVTRSGKIEVKMSLNWILPKYQGQKLENVDKKQGWDYFYVFDNVFYEYFTKIVNI